MSINPFDDANAGRRMLYWESERPSVSGLGRHMAKESVQEVGSRGVLERTTWIGVGWSWMTEHTR